MVTLVMLFLSLLNTYRAWNRPREVVRIGCDGIPSLVRINDEVYSEPDDREIRAFVAEFAVFFMRGDSFSAVNDAVWAARRMAPERREAFRRVAKGSRDRLGSVAILESLKRRTQIDASALEIEVDKKTYPWHARVKGTRQIMDESGEGQPFELGLERVRVSRNDLIEGSPPAGRRAAVGFPLLGGEQALARDIARFSAPEVVASSSAEEQARVQSVLEHILPVSARRLGLLNDAAVISSLPRYEIEKITAPTLAINSADDLYATFDGARYTAEHVPHARFIGYPKGGHLLVGHDTEATAQVTAFLRGSARF